MFWQALVWGLGASLGGSIGLMAFVVMYSGWKWLTNIKAVKSAMTTTEITLSLLSERNNLTQQQIETLDEIAESVRVMADMIARDKLNG